jgi:hypothetical protein
MFDVFGNTIDHQGAVYGNDVSNFQSYVTPTILKWAIFDHNPLGS